MYTIHGPLSEQDDKENLPIVNYIKDISSYQRHDLYSKLNTGFSLAGLQLDFPGGGISKLNTGFPLAGLQLDWDFSKRNLSISKLNTGELNTGFQLAGLP